MYVQKSIRTITNNKNKVEPQDRALPKRKCRKRHEQTKERNIEILFKKSKKTNALKA